LRINKIGDAGATWLAMGLRHSVSLASLALGTNTIKDAGAIELAEAAAASPSLSFLDLDANGIEDNGAHAISQVPAGRARHGMARVCLPRLRIEQMRRGRRRSLLSRVGGGEEQRAHARLPGAQPHRRRRRGGPHCCRHAPGSLRSPVPASALGTHARTHARTAVHAVGRDCIGRHRMAATCPTSAAGCGALAIGTSRYAAPAVCSEDVICAEAALAGA
jgi:hypothetical protein